MYANDVLCSVFLRCCVIADYFTDPDLALKIEKQMSERQQLGRMNDMLKQL